ncbi:MAG: hypothetical protein ACO3LT_09795 [Ilumatobacteraceae bacterium]
MPNLICCTDECIPGELTRHHYSIIPSDLPRLRVYGCTIIADTRMTDVERDALVRKLDKRGTLEDGATYKLSELKNTT